MTRSLLFLTFVLSGMFCTSLKAQNVATLYASTTDCSTWNCSPCDGSLTLWVGNTSQPQLYTYIVSGPGVQDTIVTVDTIITLTGLCQGYYQGNVSWAYIDTLNPLVVNCSNCPPNPNPPAPCTNPPCPTDSCTNCTGGSGGGGAGAGGPVGAPTPYLYAELLVEYPTCDYGIGSATLNIVGDAPLFQVNVNGGGWVPFGSENIIVYCGGSPYVEVMDASGQIVTAIVMITNIYDHCLTYPTVQLDYTSIEVCSGETVPLNGIQGFSYGVWGGGQDPSQQAISHSDLSVIGGPYSDYLIGTSSWYIAPFTAVNNTNSPITVPVNVQYQSACDIAYAGVTITVNPLPNPDAGQDWSICEGDPVTLNTQSTISGSTITWSSGDPNNSTIYPTNSGTYTVTETTQDGCVNTGSMDVTLLPDDWVIAGNDTTICPGDAITLNGASNTSFVWNNGVVNGQSFVPQTPGWYVATTTGSGCLGTDSLYIDFTSPSVDAGPDLIACLGDSVMLSGPINATNTWDNGVVDGVPFVPNVGTTTYNLTATFGSCSVIDSLSITVNGLPPIDAGLMQVICLDDNVTLSGSGGISYTWDNGVIDNQAFQPTTTQIYTVTGQDANGCENTDTVSVIVHPLPVIDAGSDQTICSGDSVLLDASGSTSVSWSNGVTNGTYYTPLTGEQLVATGTDQNGCSNTDTLEIFINSPQPVDAGLDQTVCLGDQVTLAASGSSNYVWSGGAIDGVPFVPPLGTTTYTVSATDGNGCESEGSVLVTVNNLPTIDAGLSQTICIGDNVTLSGSGGISYAWSNNVIDNQAFQPTTTQTYTVTGQDANGCENTDTVSVIVHPLPEIDAGSDQTICSGDSVLLDASGSTSVSWSNGVTNGTYYTPLTGEQLVATGTDQNGCSNIDTLEIVMNAPSPVDAGLDQTACLGDSVTLVASGSTNYVWSGGVIDGTAFTPPLGSTMYYVSATDGNGCESNDSVQVTVNDLPTIDAGLSQTICIGDNVTLSGSGGISYVWSNNVIDNQAFQPTTTQTYTVTGQDANGCENTDTVSVIVHPLPVIDAGSDQTICSGDSVLLDASGAPTISWNNGASNGSYFTPASSQQVVATGTDQNNCSSTDTLEIILNTPSLVDAGLDQTVCLGDSVTLAASGSANYVWSGSAIDGVPFVPPLGTTTYTVSATDGNGCESEDSLLITVNDLPAIDAGLDAFICAGDIIMLSGSGGTSYTWNNNVIDNQPFVPGSTQAYVVMGQDTIGCENTDSVLVTVNPIPIIDAGPDVTICEGDSVYLNATGALAMGWTNGAPNDAHYVPNTTEELVALGMDTNGCMSADTMNITVNAAPTIDAGLDQTVCEGEYVTLTATSSTGTIQWTAPVQNNVAFVPPSGSSIYYVSTTNTLGCFAQDSVVVSALPAPVLDIQADVTEGCAPLTVTFTNLTTGSLVDCAWDFGNGLSDVGCTQVTTTYTESGYYDVSLTVSTTNGCFSVDTFSNMIYVEPDPVASFNMTPNVLDFYDPTVVLTNMSIGATSYEWNFGDGSLISNNEDEVHTYPYFESGSYEIQLTAYSEFMCVDVAVQTILVNEDIIIYVPNSFTPNDDQFNNVFEPVISAGVDIYDYALTIFNRWGEIVFESADVSVGWDGVCDSGMCQDGTYTWRIEFKELNGDERHVLHGHVNLLK